MKETASTSANIPRIEPPLGNFSQLCTILLTALAFTYMQPILVLITTIITALNALAPVVSPYYLLYQYILVPQGWLKPYPGEEGKLAPYRFSRISTALLLASTILLFSAPAIADDWGWKLGWTLVLIVDILMMVDLGVRLSVGILRSFTSHSSEWESPMIPKKTIALLYLLGLGLMIAGAFLDRSSLASATTPLPVFIGSILYLIGWIAALTNVVKARSCLWFLTLFYLSPFTLPVYAFLGPGPTSTVSDGSPQG
jgi:hypothetical protein